MKKVKERRMYRYIMLGSTDVNIFGNGQPI